MAIMRIIQRVARAVLTFHRWFMKYSGMTMIIDNIEERRRLRRTQEQPKDDSGRREGADTHSEK